MPFDITSARKAGKTDDEIASYLSSQYNFDTDAAKKAGKTSSEIAEYLSKNDKPPVSTDSKDNEGIRAIDVPLTALSNVPESGAKFIGGVAKALTSPIDTGTALAKLAAGGLEKLIPDVIADKLPAGRANEATFDVVINHFKERYGGYENLKKTIAEDPVGFAADLSTVLGGGAGALKAAGTVSKVGGLTKAGEIAGKVASAIDPMRAVVGGAKLATQGAAGIAKHAILPLTTGRSASTISDAYKAAKSGGTAQKTFTDFLRGKSDDLELVNDLRGAFQGLKDKRAQEYGARLAKIEEESGGLILDVSSINKAIEKIAKDFRLDKIKKVKGEWKFEGVTNLTKADRKEFGEVLDLIAEWKTRPKGVTAIGLDSLKQQLDNFYTPNARIGAVVTALKKPVKNILETQVKGYADMTKGYSKATQLLSELNSSFAIGKKGNTQAVLSKVNTAMKEDRLFRKDLAKQLDDLTSKDLVAGMSGLSLNPPLPSGLLSRGIGAGEIGALLAGHLNPAMLPLVAAGSPRVVGETINLLGSAARYGEKASPVLTKTKYANPLYQAGKVSEIEENRKRK